MKLFRHAALLAAALLAFAPIGAEANTTTTNLGLNKPSVAGDTDAWGTLLNANEDTLDAQFASGTFTPAITFATPGTSSISYGAQNGTYVRAGKLVFVTIALTFTPTLGTASGDLIITGLPLAASGSTFAGGAINYATAGFSWPASHTMLAPTLASTTTLSIVALGSGQTPANIGASNLTSGSLHIVDITLVYRLP